jgi:uroporphyrinogen III methyltransferase/synthase
VISVIGRSVGLRDEISWFESRPLFGKRVVVTRATAMPGTLADLLRARGADVIEAPSTAIEALDPAAIDEAVQQLASYDWLVLTSVVGVRFFREALDRAGLDTRSLASTDIAVIGPSTARALGEMGLKPDLVPPRFVAESLLDVMRATEGMRGARVLYAGAEDARPVLADGLRELGAIVDVVATYRSRIVTEGPEVEALRADLDRRGADFVTFTSASSVSGFVAQVGADRAAKVNAISIGPVTSAAAREAGIAVVAEAAAATIPGVVEALTVAVARNG